MTTAMTPSWYDLLDVDRDATPAEIRAAWKARIADLDPTDRRFRVLNQAAEVLLDPQRRAAYDAAVEPPVEPETEFTEEASDAPDPVPLAASPITAGPEASEPKVADWVAPTWLLAIVGVLTLALVAVSVYAWTRPHASPHGPAQELVKATSVDVEESTRTAQSTAERAVGPILSYNALHLDEDQKAAESYMTSDYRKQYDQLFEVIKQNAPDTKTIVKAQVVASGIVRSGEDRVQVLLFVNRPTTNKARTTPVVYKDQVTVTMQKVDGEWLVDDMVTSPVSK